MSTQELKVLLVSSHGGHWIQLRKLVPAFHGMNIHYVSTHPDLQNEVNPAKYSNVPDANLDTKFDLIKLAFSIFVIILRYRPNVVLSTGAAPGFFALFFGKIIGAKTIWVDSIANAEQMSVSGKKVRLFADLWLTQWSDLAKKNGPFYRGSVV